MVVVEQEQEQEQDKYDQCCQHFENPMIQKIALGAGGPAVNLYQSVSDSIELPF